MKMQRASASFFMVVIYRRYYITTRLRDVRLGRAVKPCVSCAKANILANALLTASDVGKAF